MQSCRYLLAQTEKKLIPAGETPELMRELFQKHLDNLEEMQPRVGKGSLIISLQARLAKLEKPF